MSLQLQNNATTGTSEDESSYSSFYSSFLKTDEGPTSSNEGRGENFRYDLSKTMNGDMKWEVSSKPPTKRPNPHWLDNVTLTNELVYQYQIDGRTLADVLKADMFALKNVIQVRRAKFF